MSIQVSASNPMRILNPHSFQVSQVGVQILTVGFDALGGEPPLGAKKTNERVQQVPHGAHGIGSKCLGNYSADCPRVQVSGISPFPARRMPISSPRSETTVEGSLTCGPPSRINERPCPNAALMSRASVRGVSSEGVAEVFANGWPNSRLRARAIGLSGTRIPTCFWRIIITSGTSRVASSTKVNGPGVRWRMVRYAKLLTRAYLATSERSGQIRVRGRFRFGPLSANRRAIAPLRKRSHPIP